MIVWIDNMMMMPAIFVVAFRISSWACLLFLTNVFPLFNFILHMYVFHARVRACVCDCVRHVNLFLFFLDAAFIVFKGFL